MKRAENRKKITWRERILSLFYPEKCALCKECGYHLLCPSCRDKLEEGFSPKGFLAPGGNGFADGMTALFSYDHLPSKILILDWKHHSFQTYGEIFSELVYRAKREIPFLEEVQLVTFAPRSISARRRAGFDQAEDLAKAVAEALELPFEPLLYRRGNSVPQHRLSASERIANVADAFRVSRSLAGETVLLIDDIVTTGAGVRECARTLKGAGAQKVFVLCIAARTPKDKNENEKSNCEK